MATDIETGSQALTPPNGEDLVLLMLQCAMMHRVSWQLFPEAPVVRSASDLAAPYVGRLAVVTPTFWTDNRPRDWRDMDEERMYPIVRYEPVLQRKHILRPSQWANRDPLMDHKAPAKRMCYPIKGVVRDLFTDGTIRVDSPQLWPRKGSSRSWRVAAPLDNNGQPLVGIEFK